MIKLKDLKEGETFYLVLKARKYDSVEIEEYKVKKELYKKESEWCLYYEYYVDIEYVKTAYKEKYSNKIHNKHNINHLYEDKCFYSLDEAIKYKDRITKLDVYYDPEDDYLYYLGYDSNNDLIFYNNYEGYIQRLNKEDNDEIYEILGKFNYTKFIADLEEQNIFDNIDILTSKKLKEKLGLDIVVEN